MAYKSKGFDLTKLGLGNKRERALLEELRRGALDLAEAARRKAQAQGLSRTGTGIRSILASVKRGNKDGVFHIHVTTGKDPRTGKQLRYMHIYNQKPARIKLVQKMKTGGKERVRYVMGRPFINSQIARPAENRIIERLTRISTDG